MVYFFKHYLKTTSVLNIMHIIFVSRLLDIFTTLILLCRNSSNMCEQNCFNAVGCTYNCMLQSSPFDNVRDYYSFSLFKLLIKKLTKSYNFLTKYD